MSEKNYQKNLRANRKENPSGKASKLAKSFGNPISATKSIFSMVTEIRVFDILFAFPFMLAILKDISDIVLIGSVWGIGTVISICCSILGGFYIWLIGMGEIKKKARGFLGGTTKRLLVLFGGTTIEAFAMGVNFLPMQTITFLLMYIMLLYERSQNKSQEEQLAKNQQYA